MQLTNCSSGGVWPSWGNWLVSVLVVTLVPWSAWGLALETDPWLKLLRFGVTLTMGLGLALAGLTVQYVSGCPLCLPVGLENALKVVLGIALAPVVLVVVLGTGVIVCFLLINELCRNILLVACAFAVIVYLAPRIRTWISKITVSRKMTG